MDVYVNGEPAGTWETVTGNTQEKTYTVSEPGIDTMAELDTYMNDEGAISYEMVNGKKVYIRYAQLPQNNTAVSVGAISDLIVATGGVLGSYKTSGTVALVSKIMVVDAIMRAMFLSIQANEVAQANIESIHELANDYCVEGTNNIPLYVDSSGVGYVLAGAVEAVRQGLITMGAYQTGGTPEYDTTYNLDDYYTLEYCDDISIVENLIALAHAERPDVLSTYNANKGEILSYIEARLPAIINVNSYYNSRVRVSMLQKSVVPSNAVTFRGKVLKNNGTAMSLRQFYDADGNVVAGGTSYYSYNDAVDWSTANVRYNPTSSVREIFAGVYPDDATHTTRSTLGMLSPAAIAGMEVASNILAGFPDGTLGLDDVWPDWYAKKKQVATPDDSDIFLRSPAIPLDVPLDDIWTDGYAGDSEDATEGDLAETLKQAIVDAIPDILADIIDDTAVTEEDVYRIPVDDGGDTPPAEPPVLDGSSNGLWTMYNPDKQDVNDFGAWLWSDTIIDQIIRQFNSPIDAIIGFHQIYCTPTTGADKVIKAGYLNSPVSAPEVTNQYTTIDCGTVHVDEFYGNVLDYDNSQVSIYLPFVGIVPLNTNLVMGADLNVIYRIDVFTGTCLAQIKVIRENSNAVLYAFEGNCAVQIPLTATTYTGMIGALISGISAGVSFAEGDMLHATTSGLSAVMSAISGRSGAKQSGSMGSNAGSLGIRKPYLIITRAISSMPAGFETLSGLPSTELTALSSVSGFTVVRNVHLEGIPGTAEELEEIKSLLESGVIF